MNKHRKIWIEHFGDIPVDEEGFSYEIHHIDGNRNNNDISNLKMVTIREHLQIHLEQEDWFAAALISKRIGLGSEYRTRLQTGKKRPGVGGVKKGNVPWNKGLKNCFNEETIKKFKRIRAGKRHSPVKVTDEQCLQILKKFNDFEPIEGVGKKRKNGKVLTFERAFAKKYHKQYNITEAQLYNIVTGKRNVQK
jgi:hypothetical protein